VSSDRDIDQTIRSGEWNQKVSELIHNWCSHARVVKSGGVGLIEQQTGLPIGHHSMDCDYATAGGFAGWDLGEAALDFHDRNCVACTNRNPLRLPNLTQLLGRREKILAERRKAEDLAKRRRIEAHSRRKATRDALRASSPVTAHTVFEQLDQLDAQRCQEHEISLVETARLAPESFTPELIEHLFLQLEAGEHWLDEAGLQLLAILGADTSRTVACAMGALAHACAIDTACSIIENHAGKVDPSQIASAFRILVERATPTYVPLSGRHVEPQPGTLTSIWQAHTAQVVACIQRGLDSRDPLHIDYAARAITSICEIDPAFATRFSKTIVSLLVRYDLLIEFDADYSRSDEDRLYRDLQQALKFALIDSLDAVDKSVNSYLSLASEESGKLVLEAYGDLMRSNWRDEPIIEIAAHRIALVRLTTMACSSSTGEAVDALENMLRNGLPKGLEALVRREMPLLLGSAALLDQQLEKFKLEETEAKDFVTSLDAHNRINSVMRAQKALVEWVAQSAADNPAARAEYLRTLAGAPEAQERFRATMISSTAPMLKHVEGMNSVLPYLYTAIVGSSTVLRRAALLALRDFGPMRTRDLPQLVHESLVAALGDPYVIVHQAAVEVLSTFKVDDEFIPDVCDKLLNLAAVYGKSKRDISEDEFLFKVIGLLTEKHLTDDDFKGPIGKFLVACLSTMNPSVLTRRIKWIDRRLRHWDSFARIVVELYEKADSEHEAEDLERVFQELPPSTFSKVAESFVKASKVRASRPWEAAAAIELLSSNRQWIGAVDVASEVFSVIEDTPRNVPMRLFAKRIQIAAMYEASLAVNIGSPEELDRQWNEVDEAIQKDIDENASRRNLPPSVFKED